MKTNKLFKLLKFFISPLIVLLLILVIYIINGVYPFGENNLINGDFGNAYLPIYYYMYDLFNGKESLFINFKVGLGTDMYDLISVYGMLSPINWLMTFSTRSNLANFMSYLFVIRLCLLSITSFCFFDKLYKKLHIYWKILFSILYTFSGWVIVYHTNFVWLDNVILFPILLLGFKKIIDKGDYRLYTVILFLSIIYSFYIAYMELLFILFLSFGYLFFLCKKEDKTTFISKLGIGTVFALGLALVFVFPVIIRVFSSARISIDYEFNFFGDLVDKLMIVLFYGLPFVLFVIMLFCKEVNIKVRKFYLYLFLIFFSGVILNPVNLMWHSGSYAEFPYRYSFIFIMVLYCGALYYLQFNPKLQFKYVKNYYFYISSIFIFLIYLFYKFIPINVASNPASRLQSSELMFFALVISVLGIFLVYSILLIKNIKLKYCFLGLFLIICWCGWSFCYIGITSDDITKGSTSYSFNIGNYLYSFFNDEDEVIRYKNFNADMNQNYGFILGKSTISNWHMVDSNNFNAIEKLGYNTWFTIMSDRGGTLFTDNLLGVNKYISSFELDDRIYKKVDYDGKINLYELYTFLGYGFVSDEINFDKKYSNKSFEYQNQIYQDLFNKEDNILENVSFDFVDVNKVSLEENNICAKDNVEFSFYLEISELSNLYFDYDSIVYNGKDKKKYENMDEFFQINYIKVNDNFLYNPNIDDRYKKEFVSSSGIVDLGIFENEKVKVTMSLYKDFCIKEFEFSKINIDKINKLFYEYQSNVGVNFKKNKVIVNVDSEKGKNLFLPISYSDNYICKVNGKEVKIEKVLDTFVLIPIDDGDNEVIISYYPSYLKECLIVSCVFLLLFVIFVRFKIILNIVIFNVFYYLILIFMFFYVYIFGFIRMLL